MTESQPTLPGLDSPRPDATPMEQAARDTITRLRDEGRLTDQHQVPAQLVIDLARAVGISAEAGKAAGMAMAARELREALLLLPQTVNDEFGNLQRELEEANRKGANP